MSHCKRAGTGAAGRRQSGFSLVELMVALSILLVVSGVVTVGMMQMLKTQGTVANRTEMHSSVRSATELLQQEIGQAGRVTLPPGPQVTLQTPVVVVPGTPVTLQVTLSSAAGMFNGEQLVIDSGNNPVGGAPNQETVTVTNLVGSQFTGVFNNSHNVGAPITVQGAFASGVVPQGDPTIPNGSDGTHLKLYGDINGDQNMVFIEYDCNLPVGGGTGTLTRSVTPWNALPPKSAPQTLLDNLLTNPGGTPCFAYQQQTVIGVTFVTDVAVTLTVQTQLLDPQTHQFQQETKALLNVSPRNIFDVWELASAGINDRVQPMPPTIVTLLP